MPQRLEYFTFHLKANLVSLKRTFFSHRSAPPLSANYVWSLQVKFSSCIILKTAKQITAAHIPSRTHSRQVTSGPPGVLVTLWERVSQEDGSLRTTCTKDGMIGAACQATLSFVCDVN
jgi:hypothetical protein